MKYKILIAFLFFLMSVNEVIARVKKSPLHFELFFAGYDLAPLNWVGYNDDTLFCFAFVLTNTSNRPVSIGHYTCSWLWYFRPTTKDFDFSGYMCTANYPTKTELKPGQTCLNYTFLRKMNPDAQSLQFLFTFIEGNKYIKLMDQLMFFDRENRKGIKNEIRKNTIILKSNTCRIKPLQRITYFDHTWFSSPEEFPYYWIGYNDYKNKSTINLFSKYAFNRRAQ